MKIIDNLCLNVLPFLPCPQSGCKYLHLDDSGRCMVLGRNLLLLLKYHMDLARTASDHIYSILADLDRIA